MRFNPPNKVRALLYVLTAVGTPLVAYLASKGVIGDLEVGLWSAEVAVVNVMAGLNVQKQAMENDPENVWDRNEEPLIPVWESAIDCEDITFEEDVEYQEYLTYFRPNLS